MIRNRAQLNRAKRELSRLRGRLEGLRRKKVPRSLVVLQAASLRKASSQLEDQVKGYEDAAAGRVNRALLENLLDPELQHGRPRIGDAIFLLRTAKGWTQSRLAKRVGTKREAIARWERDDYNAYTLESLQRIFEALGYRLGIRVISAAG